MLKLSHTTRNTVFAALLATGLADWEVSYLFSIGR